MVEIDPADKSSISSCLSLQRSAISVAGTISTNPRVFTDNKRKCSCGFILRRSPEVTKYFCRRADLFIKPCLKMRDGRLGGAHAHCSGRGSSLEPDPCSGHRAFPGRRTNFSFTGCHVEDFKITLLSLSSLLMRSAKRVSDQCKQTDLLHQTNSV